MDWITTLGPTLDKYGWPSLILAIAIVGVYKVCVFFAPLIRRICDTIADGFDRFFRNVNHILETTIEDKQDNAKQLERHAVHAERTDTSLSQISDRLDVLTNRCVYGNQFHQKQPNPGPVTIQPSGGH